MQTFLQAAHLARTSVVSRFAFVAIVVPLILAGCATTIPTVDLSETIYSSNTTIKKADREIAELAIQNTADTGKNSGASITDVPMIRQPFLHVTVEKDIRRFFEERLTYDSSSNRVISVKIEKANVKANWPGGVFIPLIGLAMINNDIEIRMNLKMSVSIQEDGKEVASYSHDAPITIQGKVSTQKKTDESYKLLVAAYRAKIFSELDKQLIEKYFAN